MNCKLCNHKKVVTMICTLDNTRMCDNCTRDHMEVSNHAEHIMSFIDWFKKQNELEKKKLVANVSLKKIIQENIDRLPADQKSLIQSLRVRRAEIYNLIDTAADGQIEKAMQSRNFGKYQFEKSFHALYSKNPSSSGLAHIISNFTEEEQVSKLVFSEVVRPKHNLEVQKLIKASLELHIKVYPESKPIPLVYLKPNSSSIYWMNCLNKKLEKIESPDMVFSMYYSWCALPDFSVFFSGGCSKVSINSEAFVMQPNSANRIQHPPMITGRYMHGMVHLNNFIYVFGGTTANGNTKLCEKFSIKDSVWENIGNLNSAKVKATVCTLKNKIYIGDENDIEVYNTDDNTFKVLSVFNKIHYMIIAPLESSLFIFRKDSLYEVTLEPEFTTRLVHKIPLIEYCSLGPPVCVSSKLYFLLDFNKTIYNYDLETHDLKVIASLN
jgi:Kelch motif